MPNEEIPPREEIKVAVLETTLPDSQIQVVWEVAFLIVWPQDLDPVIQLTHHAASNFDTISLRVRLNIFSPHLR